MRALRTLCVGVSGRGRWPLHTCGEDTGFEVVSLCDLDTGALREARKITGLEEDVCYTDYEEALSKSGAEAVIICTPTAFHCPMAREAISRGLPVLCEKGMAPDWETARDVVSFVRSHEGVFCVSQNYRYSALERTVHRCVHDEQDPNHVGDVFLVDLHHHRVRPIPRTLDYPFASVWDMSCHHFDDLLFWLGPVAEVTAHAYRAGWSAYDHAANTSVFMTFENGASVNYFHGHDSARGEFRVGVHGHRGALTGATVADTASTKGIDRLEFSPRPAVQFGTSEPYDVPFEDAPGEAGVLSDFRSYIDGGPEPGISGYNNLEVMAMCQMVVMSAEQGRRIRRDALT